MHLGAFKTIASLIEKGLQGANTYGRYMVISIGIWLFLFPYVGGMT